MEVSGVAGEQVFGFEVELDCVGVRGKFEGH